MLFHRLSLEAFCHATEDPGRVREAMRNVLPEALREAKFKEQRVEGSFGNGIIIFSLEFERHAEVKELVDFIKENIKKEDLEYFDIEEHVTDNDEFWMRLDKQEACGGRLVLGGQDTIQLKGKVAAFPAKREKALEMMETLWLGAE